MTGRTEVLAGDGLVLRRAGVAVWLGPGASGQLIAYLDALTRKLEAESLPGRQMTDPIEGVLRAGDPEPAAAFAVLADGPDGREAVLHGGVQVWDGTRWVLPQPVPGWLHWTVPNGAPVVVAAAGSSAPPMTPSSPLDLRDGTVPGAGLVLVPGDGPTPTPEAAGPEAAVSEAAVSQPVAGSPGLAPPEPAPAEARPPEAGLFGANAPETVARETVAPEAVGPDAASPPVATPPEAAPAGAAPAEAAPPGVGLEEAAAAGTVVLDSPGGPPPPAAAPTAPEPAGGPSALAPEAPPPPEAALAPPAPPPPPAAPPSPPLAGTLTTGDGSAYRLDGDYVVGSNPDGDDAVRQGSARPLRLPAPEDRVAPVHADVRVFAGEVRVIDRGTGAGSYVLAPGSQQWSPLVPGVPQVLSPGMYVSFGQKVLRFEPPTGE